MISLVAMAVIAASIGSNIYLTKQLARSISLIEELARPPVASRKEASHRKPATMPKQASGLASKRVGKQAASTGEASRDWWQVAALPEWAGGDVAETTFNLLDHDEPGKVASPPPVGLRDLGNGWEMLIASNPTNQYEYVAKKRPIAAHARQQANGNVSQVAAYKAERKVRQVATATVGRGKGK